jgi:hypothetical protein
MAPDSDHLFKRLWLVNGVMFLVALVGIIGVVTYTFVTETFGDRGPEVRAEPNGGEGGGPPTARAVRYSSPESIRGTAVQLIEVHHGSAAVSSAMLIGAAASSMYRDSDGPMVNAIFLDPGAASGRLLLDRPAFIRSMQFPRYEDDSLQHFISYSIVFEDTNGDETLDADDAEAVYVTDLEGRGLKRASPEGILVQSHDLLPDGRLLILGVAQPPKGEKDERMPQRAFVHDFARATTTPLTALDSLALRAGTVLRGR